MEIGLEIYQLKMRNMPEYTIYLVRICSAITYSIFLVIGINRSSVWSRECI